MTPRNYMSLFIQASLPFVVGICLRHFTQLLLIRSSGRTLLWIALALELLGIFVYRYLIQRVNSRPPVTTSNDAKPSENWWDSILFALNFSICFVGAALVIVYGTLLQLIDP